MDLAINYSILWSRDHHPFGNPTARFEMGGREVIASRKLPDTSDEQRGEREVASSPRNNHKPSVPVARTANKLLSLLHLRWRLGISSHVFRVTRFLCPGGQRPSECH